MENGMPFWNKEAGKKGMEIGMKIGRDIAAPALAACAYKEPGPEDIKKPLMKLPSGIVRQLFRIP